MMTDHLGRDDLHYAVADGDLDLVIALLDEAGTSPDLRDGRGWTPLHVAAARSRSEIAEVLLDRGAAVDAVDDKGNTPLARATFQARGCGDLVLLLLDAGADPDHPNAGGVSPRALAAKIANYDNLQFFRGR